MAEHNKPRKPLRRRSEKRERLYEIRREFVSKLLFQRPYCEAKLSGCTLKSVDVHETWPRGRGGGILPGGNVFMCLCRPCHRWITDHPKEAHELGFLRHSWEVSDAEREAARLEKRIPPSPDGG